MPTKLNAVWVCALLLSDRSAASLLAASGPPALPSTVREPLVGRVVDKSTHDRDMAVPRLRISLDLFAPPTLPVAVIEGAMREAGEIWRPYGVDLSWIAGLETLTAVADRRLIVRMNDERVVAPRPDGTRVGSALGWVEFLPDGRPRNVLHVSVDATRRLLARRPVHGRSLSDAPPRLDRALLARAIGRSLAHELGHYLLESKVHTNRGLMRPSFNVVDLVAVSRDRFRLEPEDADLLTTRLCDPRGRIAALGTAVQETEWANSKGQHERHQASGSPGCHSPCSLSGRRG